MARSLFFGGKGGVGKTSCAAAYALSCAAAGQRTLLVSTDPAHNLADLFGRAPGPTPARLRPDLDVVELDPERETRRYLDEVKATLRPLVSGERSSTVFRQLDLARHAPGTEEAALFDALVGLLLEAGRDYDRLVFDTAPGGHTVRLLALPEIMGAWVDGLMQRRRKVRSDYKAWLGDGEVVDDPIQEALMRRRGRLAAAREHLTCAAHSAVVLVANPERLPTLETVRTRELLEAHGLHVGALAINKCLPAHVDGDWLANWRDEQRPWIERLDETFADRPVRRIDHQPRAPASCDDLAPMIDALGDLAPWRAHDT
ncbi:MULTISPECIES: TRC40/GET3/ArsA family transport-energizing ATPase [unclassified Modicisalibacter]|uniref:ArsA family ATPase n=1 Tax=unclassified Modicisalibacter TaxID=2679913 RepID=UPI001CC9D536|nr:MULTISPECIES: TRC40/GET3/ArsA family transport-energizing ATPase [unclassified Modicisalibacter]MBZ9559235.1 TRC40/GET3/ArsA family transport-energizing ATPase [Modicisalibacter sp. R2A 31.J]MBZ9576600.1 TRC40/GET3/ArsA family transport-energizing ATPase [Modicisalibacter sp. MOD 31.J]